MNGTSPRFPRINPFFIVLLPALVCSAFSSDDFSAIYQKALGGEPEAQFNLGFAYDRGKGILQGNEEAVKWYRKAADQGHAGAQYSLGIAYDQGKGVPQDKTEAVKWYRKAAEQGHASAQTNLGSCYYKGKGVPQDYAVAVTWWRKGAERGDIGAQNNLGIAYYNGQGVPRDHLLAYFWYSLSASRSKGEDYGKRAEMRNGIANRLTPEQRMKVQQMIREWEAKHPNN